MSRTTAPTTTKHRSARKTLRSGRASALTGLALVLAAGVLAVWRPWSDVPEPVAASEEQQSPGQRAAMAVSQILSQRLPLSPARERPSLLVTPLQPQRSASDLDYLAEGITANLIAKLSALPGLNVVGTDTTFARANLKDSPGPGILGSIRYRLEGGVDLTAGQMVLEARFIDASDSRVLWEERLDRPLSELPLLEALLVDRVSKSTGATARRHEAASERALGETALRSLDLTLRAQHLYRSQASPRPELIRELLEEGIAIEPSSLIAHTTLYAFLANQYSALAGQDHADRTRALLNVASRAVSLAPTDPLARASYADSLTFTGQHGTAVAQVEASVGTTGMSSEVLRLAARVMERSGEHEKAVNLMQRALQNDPLIHPAVLASPLASALYLLGRYQEAADYAGRCVQRAPNLQDCLLWRAAALAQVGALSEARDTVAALRREQPEATINAHLQALSITYRNAEDLRHLAEGLRKAGMPD